ncbi:MAG TPA: N-acetylmuramoyl-L-alanine amidase [Egibacteraceae bacterium]|nr:N-acetylmuramoyl-L-alanine amidase [Egibacteraceae bacterium]
MHSRVVSVSLLTLLLLVWAPGPPADGADVVSPVTRTVVEGLAPAPGDDGRAGLSARVRTPVPFSLVGVAIPAGTRVLLRTGDEAGRWSPWMEVEPLAADGDGPDPGSAEAVAARRGWTRMSEPVWVGEASRLQLRVRGGSSRDVAVHLVDSVGLSRSLLQRATDALRTAGRGTATAEASTRPAIVTRAQWGADESLRRGRPEYAKATRAGILHHTATSNDYSRERAPAVIRAIYTYHTQSLGWDDIGYNLLVDRYGTVYEGRAGGVGRGVVGAHAGGFNSETFGVTIIGTFTSGLPPRVAMDAAVATIAWKFAVHGINTDPNATVDMASRGSTRYPKGHRARLHTLSGHRDVSTTACPGDALYPHLPELRRQVHGGRAPAPQAQTPPPSRRRLLPPLPKVDQDLSQVPRVHAGAPDQPPAPAPAPAEPPSVTRELPLPVTAPLPVARELSHTGGR